MSDTEETRITKIEFESSDEEEQEYFDDFRILAKIRLEKIKREDKIWDEAQGAYHDPHFLPEVRRPSRFTDWLAWYAKNRSAFLDHGIVGRY